VELFIEGVSYFVLLQASRRPYCGRPVYTRSRVHRWIPSDWHM